MSFFLLKKNYLNLNNSKYLLSRAKDNRTGNKYTNIIPNNPIPIQSDLGNRLMPNNPGNMKRKLGENSGAYSIALTPGQEAPNAYIGKREFPDWYRPYLANYAGSGFLITFFLAFCMISYVQYKTVCKLKGRDSLAPYNREGKFVWKFNIRKWFCDEVKNNDDVIMYKYVRRYMKESGF